MYIMYKNMHIIHGWMYSCSLFSFIKPLINATVTMLLFLYSEDCLFWALDLFIYVKMEPYLLSKTIINKYIFCFFYQASNCWRKGAKSWLRSQTRKGTSSTSFRKRQYWVTCINAGNLEATMLYELLYIIDYNDSFWRGDV